MHRVLTFVFLADRDSTGLIGLPLWSIISKCSKLMALLLVLA